MSKELWDPFADRLDEMHQWPCSYEFKCIVPRDGIPSFEQIYRGYSFDFRDSKSGAYRSFTITFQAGCSQDVVRMYQLAAGIPGAVTL
ncbi:MAG: DUF493 domain-containing protein [Candidatus Methylacidiphilales bacterium]